MTTGDLFTNKVAIGLDLSLTGSGIASSQGWCELQGRDGVTKLTLPGRIKAIDGLATAICAMAGTPDIAVVESPAIVRTAGGVLERHALWWRVAEILISRGVNLVEVSPTSRATYATGKGTADKGAVIAAVTRTYPDFETNGNNNLCDAVVLCAIGMDLLGEPLAKLPATHRRALDKIVS